MRIVRNTKYPDRVLILAETDNDRETLKILYDSHIIFGLYQIWLKSPDGKGENLPEIKPYLEKIPTLTGLGWLNIVKGFVPTKILI